MARHQWTDAVRRSDSVGHMERARCAHCGLVRDRHTFYGRSVANFTEYVRDGRVIGEKAPPCVPRPATRPAEVTT